MRIDMTTKLCDVDGTPFKDGATIRSVLQQCLLNPISGDDSATGAEKAELFSLAMRCMQDTPNFSAEEITKLKERVGRGYPSPLVVGRTYEVLDPPPAATEEAEPLKAAE